MRENGDPTDSLLPQPGQYNAYNPTFHKLPGPWAQEQMNSQGSLHSRERRPRETNELQRALAAERSQHEASMRQQGITPGKAIYENPRETQNTLLPTEKYGN